jgi:hypothetical protein
MKTVLIVGAGAQGGPCTSILAGEDSVDPNKFFKGMAERGVPFEMDEKIIKLIVLEGD